MVDVGSNRYHDLHRNQPMIEGPRSPYMDEPYVFSVVQALGSPRVSSCCRRMSDPGGRHRAVACIPHEYFAAPGVTATGSQGGGYSSSSSDNEIDEGDNVFQGVCGGGDMSPAHQSLLFQERARYRWSVPLLPAAAFTARRRSRASSLPRLDVPLIETSEEHEEDCDTAGEAVGGQSALQRTPQRIIRPLSRHGRTMRQHSTSRRRHSESVSLEVISEDSDWLPSSTGSSSRRFSCSPNSG